MLRVEDHPLYIVLIMSLFLQIIGALGLWIVTKAIYNLKFHPLAKYPGPKSWIISRIPYLICLNAGQLPFRIKEFHDEYGPIVRVSANELSFNSSEAWKDILSRKDMLRPPQWGSRPPGVEAHNVISAPASDHARFRKALNPAYSERSIKEYEPVIRKYLDMLMSQFDALIKRQPDDGPAIVDLVNWFNFTTFDIIGELSWSKSYGCLESGTGHAFMGVLLHFQAVIIGASISYYPWLNAMLFKMTPKSAFQMLENIFQDGKQRLQDRMKVAKPEHPDLVQHINNYNATCAPENKLSPSEIEQNVLAIIVGGSETLTTVFSGALHYLLADAPKLNKLTHEIRSTFTSATDINANSVAKLPYLNAVIDETLRVCPPIPDMLRRQVPSNAPVTIVGHIIPPETTVSISCYSTFKSVRYFSQPDVFEPMRHISPVPNTKDKQRSKDSDYSPLSYNDFSAFHPFSLGPRNCPGQALARMEMRLLLALLLFRFDVRSRGGTVVRSWTDQKIYWTWEKMPLEVEIWRA